MGLTQEQLARYDGVIIATDHTGVDYQAIVEASPLVVDTRNATRGIAGAAGKIIRA